MFRAPEGNQDPASEVMRCHFHCDPRGADTNATSPWEERHRICRHESHPATISGDGPECLLSFTLWSPPLSNLSSGFLKPHFVGLPTSRPALRATHPQQECHTTSRPALPRTEPGPRAAVWLAAFLTPGPHGLLPLRQSPTFQTLRSHSFLPCYLCVCCFSTRKCPIPLPIGTLTHSYSSFKTRLQAHIHSDATPHLI